MRRAYYFNGNIIKFVFRKHHCPWCNTLLLKKLDHRIINSNSEEAKPYSSLFIGTDGVSLIGDFDTDIRHHIFHCSNCDKEIEHRTLFSYYKVKKIISKLRIKAKNKSILLKETYLDKADNEIGNEQREFFDKVLITLIISERIINKICFVADKYKKFEQATYFKSTGNLKEVKRILQRHN